MTPQNRIDNIVNFVEGHRFLAGCEFKVDFDEAQDKMVVTFKKLTEDQDRSIRASFIAHGMKHVAVVVVEVTDKVKPPHHNLDHRRRGGFKKFK